MTCKEEKKSKKAPNKKRALNLKIDRPINFCRWYSVREHMPPVEVGSDGSKFYVVYSSRHKKYYVAKWFPEEGWSPSSPDSSFSGVNIYGHISHWLDAEIPFIFQPVEGEDE